VEFGLFSLFDFFRDRQNEVAYYRDTLDLILLSEKLGYDSVWLGEEHFYSFGICPSPQMFLAAVARETSRIRLGTAISLLPFENPLRKAEDFAMLDLLSNGRLNFGVGRGIIPAHFAGFAVDPHESRARYEESLAIIRQAWTQNTFSYEGKFWQVPSLSLAPKPVQKPHPPIVVTAVAPFSKGVTEAAARGWDPISANFLMPAWVKSHWPRYVEGCERAGRAADPANWRVAKSVFVAKDAATAKAYATDPDGPYVYYYRSLFTKLKRNGRIELFKTYRDQPDDEVTLESICDRLIIWGTPESVADQILAFQAEVGDFGTLLYAGKDWKDRELGRQSMILMAEKVMPRVNAGNSYSSNAGNESSANLKKASRGSN